MILGNLVQRTNSTSPRSRRRVDVWITPSLKCQTPSHARAWRGAGQAGRDSEKRDPDSISALLRPPVTVHLQRTGAADGVLQELERHRIANREIIERDAVLEVASRPD